MKILIIFLCISLGITIAVASNDIYQLKQETRAIRNWIEALIDQIEKCREDDLR